MGIYMYMYKHVCGMGEVQVQCAHVYVQLHVSVLSVPFRQRENKQFRDTGGRKLRPCPGGCGEQSGATITDGQG